MKMKKIVLIVAFVATVVSGCFATLVDDKYTLSQSSGIRLENLNTAVIPGDDFYEFAGGSWLKNNPLTGEYASFGSFDKLGEETRQQLKSLIEDLSSRQNAKGSIEQKIVDLYKISMDSDKLNAEGTKPVEKDLSLVRSIVDKDQLATLIANLQRSGVAAYWNFGVVPDFMQSSMNILYLNQGGIGMGERGYYFDNDTSTKNIRKKYKKHVVKMFTLFGFNPADAKKAAATVIRIENYLAKAAYSKEKNRDPYAVYHKMSVAELKQKYSSFDWVSYFKALNISPKNLNVRQPEALEAALEIINKEPLLEQKLYLQWCIMNASGHYLSDAIANQDFSFFGKTMSGKKERPPRWKDAIGTENRFLGEALGQMYVRKYFLPEAKTRVLQLTKNLQAALSERIAELGWMSGKTKNKAQEKLSTLRIKIGYPDKWRDFSALEIINDSYYDNYKRAVRFGCDYQLAKEGKPVNHDEWYMLPQIVNACYEPSFNEICFPAAILQYPFFDMNADDAFNYGAIGAVIGHEITNGFDDRGRRYDKDGNLKDWWTSEDAEKFAERTKVLVNFFDNILVAPGVHANGQFTLGENLADYGGLTISFQAFKNATKNAPIGVKDGFTPEQRFFLAYANIWTGNVRKEEILCCTKKDPHSLNRWRVNGTLPQIDEWYNAFNVTSENKLYLPKEERISIW